MRMKRVKKRPKVDAKYRHVLEIRKFGYVFT